MRLNQDEHVGSLCVCCEGGGGGLLVLVLCALVYVSFLLLLVVLILFCFGEGGEEGVVSADKQSLANSTIRIIRSMPLLFLKHHSLFPTHFESKVFLPCKNDCVLFIVCIELPCRNDCVLFIVCTEKLDMYHR